MRIAVACPIARGEGAALIYDDRVTAVVFVSEETGINERRIGLSLNDVTGQATMPRDLTAEFDWVVDRSYLDVRSSTARQAFDPIGRR